MFYNNELEGRLNYLERELRIALNDIEVLKDGILDIEAKLENFINKEDKQNKGYEINNSDLF